MARSQTRVEKLNSAGRRDAEALAEQLRKFAGKRSAKLQLQGTMLKLLRELTELALHHPGVVIVPVGQEISPADAAKILGISRPTVVGKMDSGELPFRREGTHRRCKLEDVLRLKSTTDARTSRRRFIPKGEVDKLVLGTTNAPYRTAVTAPELAKRIASRDGGPWNVHLATFFTDVRPELILRFAEIHGISARSLASSYQAMKAMTGEQNPALETAFEQLAPSA